MLQVVTADPEIMVYERGSSGGRNEFILLASDGLWDVFENLDAGNFLVSRLPVGVPLDKVSVCGLWFLHRRPVGQVPRTAIDACLNSHHPDSSPPRYL